MPGPVSPVAPPGVAEFLSRFLNLFAGIGLVGLGMIAAAVIAAVVISRMYAPPVGSGRLLWIVLGLGVALTVVGGLPWLLIRDMAADLGGIG